MSLLITSTSTPTPTPAVPPMAIVPARLRIVVVSDAETATPVLEPPTVTPESMCASVWLFMMSTTTEPATPALSPPLAPTAIRVTSSFWVAETVRPVPPFAWRSAPASTPASTRPCRSMTITETATAPDEALIAPPPASSSVLKESEAVMPNDWPAWTVPPTSAFATGSLGVTALMTTTMTDPSTAASDAEAAKSTASSWKFSVDVADTVMSFSADTVAPEPIWADTCFSMTSTTIPMPTPAPLVEKASPPARFVNDVSSVALTSTFCSDAFAGPPRRPGNWLTWAPPSIHALVVRKRTLTTTEPLTAALSPEAAPDMATEESLGSVIERILIAGASTSAEVAVTLTPSTASTCVTWLPPSEAMKASVVMSGKTLTEIAPPTAAPPFEKAPETAMFCRPSLFFAETSTPPFEISCAPLATEASVWKKTTSTPIDAATLAPPFSDEVPPLPARPHTMRSFSWPEVLTASTVIPWPVTTASRPTVALFLMSAKLTPTAAAT